MRNLLSYFTKDDTTYSDDGIIMYCFDEQRSDEFIESLLLLYRQAYISDEKLQQNIDGMGSTRTDEIKGILPTQGNIRSGEFGEILSFLIFTSLYPEYNVTPIRWRWKEERDRAIHFTDIMLLYCLDEKNPQNTDKLMTVEVKTRATQPGKNNSSINEAIVGTLNDSVDRGAKTLLFLQQKLKNDGKYDDAKKVKRFQRAVEFPYIYT